jgi:dienelactone hydrolase
MNEKKIFISIVALLSLPLLSVQAADAYVVQREQVLALGQLTSPPRTFEAEGRAAEGDARAIFFEALPYQGRPTRVFAWLGVPKKRAGKIPGVVLVHGGGGTAFKEWVQRWNERGYAAICIAVEGQTDEKASGDTEATATGWKRHAWSGPQRAGIYGDSAKPMNEQWIYHAVADAVLANSLLRALPEVDASKIGVMGVSWGGVITSTVIGIDARFAFAIPVYGCGHLFDSENQYGRALGDNTLYREVWDPMVRLGRVTMPVLWFSWPEDKHFPMDCLAASYRATSGPRMVSLIPGMKHGHGPAWLAPDSYAFADSVVQAGTPWFKHVRTEVAGGRACFVFTSAKIANSATLVSTTDTGFTGNRTWIETQATLEKQGGEWRSSAPLPVGTTAWFINIRSGALTASSEFQEVRTASHTSASPARYPDRSRSGSISGRSNMRTFASLSKKGKVLLNGNNHGTAL